jgi:hypothetical protein
MNPHGKIREKKNLILGGMGAICFGEDILTFSYRRVPRAACQPVWGVKRLADSEYRKKTIDFPMLVGFMDAS